MLKFNLLIMKLNLLILELLKYWWTNLKIFRTFWKQKFWSENKNFGVKIKKIYENKTVIFKSKKVQFLKLKNFKIDWKLKIILIEL